MFVVQKIMLHTVLTHTNPKEKKLLWPGFEPGFCSHHAKYLPLYYHSSTWQVRWNYYLLINNLSIHTKHLWSNDAPPPWCRLICINTSHRSVWDDTLYQYCVKGHSTIDLWRWGLCRESASASDRCSEMNCRVTSYLVKVGQWMITVCLKSWEFPEIHT